MLREFFHSATTETRTWAWLGLLVFVLHSLFGAILKFRLNGWFELFYDQLQAAAPSGACVGNQTSCPLTSLEGERAAVTRLLVDFALIVSPAVVVDPLGKWVASMWRLRWRLALVESYLSHYDTTTPPIEGASQRIHEDTARFEVGLYSCLTVVLDSVFTLIVFTPILLQIGTTVQLPGWNWSPWLFSIAATAAVMGLAISIAVGHRLVGLEVNNQRIEADLRTRLVLMETTPDSETTTTHEACEPPQLPLFEPVLSRLVDNYKRLFANFAAFNVWIGTYQQTLVLLPYVLCAPLMFADAPADRISLGLLVKITNAFGKVFGAMAVVASNWSSINEFRSTVRRLAEFERATYGRTSYDPCRVVKPLCNSSPDHKVRKAKARKVRSRHREAHVELCESSSPDANNASPGEPGEPSIRASGKKLATSRGG